MSSLRGDPNVGEEGPFIIDRGSVSLNYESIYDLGEPVKWVVNNTMLRPSVVNKVPDVAKAPLVKCGGGVGKVGVYLGKQLLNSMPDKKKSSLGIVIIRENQTKDGPSIGFMVDYDENRSGSHCLSVVPPGRWWGSTSLEDELKLKCRPPLQKVEVEQVPSIFSSIFSRIFSRPEEVIAEYDGGGAEDGESLSSKVHEKGMVELIAQIKQALRFCCIN